jgi:hypothetical protein
MKPVIDPHSKFIASGLAVFSAMALTAFGQQLPEPLLYFPLDEAIGATVAVDSTGKGYDGTVVSSVTFGEGGAPGGATPSGAARFTDGILDVTTFDVPALLGQRDGAGGVDTASYTMVAWIKPDAASLTGDRFFFGQSSQGIHNGLRQNGRLHQAHWGNDHYANTILNDTDWVHATFVYDGAADLGTIYLNGKADSDPTAKASPNGSGNLIIGGRQGGEAWYNGLIDDVAVWDSILTDAQIQELADGVIPFSPVTGEDNENGGAGDGMDDGWEAANGLDPAIDDSAGNPDNDGLTNLEEWNGGDNPTDPIDADSDNDDLTDGDEVNTHGTDPNDADSDNDGLNDGAEIAASTLPLDPDTDGDEMSDGYEVDSGHNPLLAADAAEDADNDGSLNLEECQRGTDPNEQDTDMDGLSDSVEDGGGTFVSATMTGTDPLDADTDDDGLNDGDELVDGTDPLDPASGPISGTVRIDFGPNDGTQGNETANPDSAGNYWNNVSANGGVVPGLSLSSLLTVGNLPTAIKVTMGNGWNANGINNGGLLDPSSALLGEYAIDTVTQDYFYTYGGNAGSLEVSGLDPQVLYQLRIFGTRNTNEYRETTYSITGSGAAVAQALQTSGGGVSEDGLSGGNDNTFLEFNDIQPDVMGRLQVEAVVTGGSYAYLGFMEISEATPKAPLQFSDISFDDKSDPGNIIVTLTFASKVGTTYALLTSTDLDLPVPSWFEIDDTIEGEKTMTTVVVNFNSNSIAVSDLRRFFAVMEME